VLHLDVTPGTAHRRLTARAEDPRAVSDADLGVYERLAPAFEAPTASEATGLVRLDGDHSTDDLLDDLLAQLLDD
jgi:thymidylate kinase